MWLMHIYLVDFYKISIKKPRHCFEFVFASTKCKGCWYGKTCCIICDCISGTDVFQTNFQFVVKANANILILRVRSKKCPPCSHIRDCISIFSGHFWYVCGVCFFRVLVDFHSSHFHFLSVKIVTFRLIWIISISKSIQAAWNWNVADRILAHAFVLEVIFNRHSASLAVQPLSILKKLYVNV